MATEGRDGIVMAGVTFSAMVPSLPSALGRFFGPGAVYASLVFELLVESVGVGELPVLDHDVVLQPVQADAGQSHLPPCWFDAEHLLGVRASNGPPPCHQVAVLDDLVDLQLRVGERCRSMWSLCRKSTWPIPSLCSKR